MECNDRLYGKIGLEGPVEKLLSCSKIQRLNSVSLSAAPDAFLKPWYFKDMASRLEHSIGMSHIVGILCESMPEFSEFKSALLLSAMCHDAGTPPFSHNCEHLLEELAGINHEQYTEHVLKGSAVEDIIKEYGHSLSEISGIINGNSTVTGKLMNNTIDIDNMDNTERYGFSSGRVGRISDPERLVKAFMLRNGSIYLDAGYAGDVEKWKECRRRVYGEIVYSDTNLSAGSMLKRALGFLYEEEGRNLLKSGFFMLTDEEALKHMEESSADAKVLIGMARGGILYKKAAEISSSNPSERMKELCKGWKGRLELSDCVCEKFGVRRYDISVYASAYKPERNISNFYPAGPKARQQEDQKINFNIRVFINPALHIDAKKIQGIICGLSDMRQ